MTLNTKRPLYLFAHIEKCGGTTLIEMLRRNFALRHVDIIPCQTDTNYVSSTDLRRALRLQPWAISFAGHSIRPFCDFGEINREIKMYTLLRDPVKRYHSDYLHDVTRRGYEGTIWEWMDFEDRHNFQTRAMSATGDLEEAKDVIARMAAFGIVESFDTFVRDMEALLHPVQFATYYRKMNPAMLTQGKREGEAPPRPMLSGAEQIAIAERNEKDIALYKWARDLISKREDTGGGASLQSSHVSTVDRIRVQLNRAQRNLWYKPWMGYKPGQLHALPRNAVDSKTWYEQAPYPTGRK